MNSGGDVLHTKGRGCGPWKQGQEHRVLRRPQDPEHLESFTSKQGQEHRVLRRPHDPGHHESFTPSANQPTGSMSNCNMSNSASTDPRAGGDVFKKSTLSADAKEFYPKGYQATTHNPPVHNQVGESGDGSQNLPQMALDRVCEVMYCLTVSPGKFDVLVKQLTDVLRLGICEVHTLSAVVNVIFEQSISEANFRYNGARLCNFLNNQPIQVENANFRDYLIQRCNEEFKIAHLLLAQNPQRLHGFILFEAELFLQLKLQTGHRISGLGEAIIDLLNLLLNFPIAENLKCVCQTVKLTGLALEEEKKAEMDLLMKRIVDVARSCPMDNSMQHLLHSVIELQQVGWGRNCGVPTTQMWNSAYPQSNPYLVNEPVFYGPDGQMLTAEESRFLQENVARTGDGEEEGDEYGDIDDSDWPENWSLGDEMDEEIEAAFEQFLQLGPNST